MATDVIQITGLTEMEAKLLSSKLLDDPLKGVLTDMGKLAKSDADAGAPKHIKITRRTSRTTVTVKAVGADAATWEIGRKPNSKQPPRKTIAAWAQTKGIDPALVYPIARSIGKKGLKGRFYMKHAASVVEAALPGRMAQMSRELEEAWSK